MRRRKHELKTVDYSLTCFVKRLLAKPILVMLAAQTNTPTLKTSVE